MHQVASARQALAHLRELLLILTPSQLPYLPAVAGYLGRGGCSFLLGNCEHLKTMSKQKTLLSFPVTVEATDARWSLSH